MMKLLPGQNTHSRQATNEGTLLMSLVSRYFYTYLVHPILRMHFSFKQMNRGVAKIGAGGRLFLSKIKN